MTFKTLRLRNRIIVLVGNPSSLELEAKKTVRGNFALYLLDAEV